MEGMCIRHGRAQKARNSRTSKRDLDIVGIQESWEKEGGEIGRKVGEYAWIGKKKKGQHSKNRGVLIAGGVGFLVEEYLCDIKEVTKDTKFDESMCIRVPGERGAKCFFLGNICMPPESKITVKEIQWKFEEIASFSFSFCLSSGGWVKIKLKLPHFYVSDTCRISRGDRRCTKV